MIRHDDLIAAILAAIHRQPMTMKQIKQHLADLKIPATSTAVERTVNALLASRKMRIDGQAQQAFKHRNHVYGPPLPPVATKPNSVYMRPEYKHDRAMEYAI